MEISNKDKKLLVYLLAISIISGTYFFAAKPLMDKQEKINNEITGLKSQVSHYSDIYNNQSEYEQQIADAQARYEMEIASFGNDLSQENTIMMLRDIEKNTGVWISKVSFQDIEIMAGEPNENTTDEENITDSSYSVSRQALNLDYSIDYSKLKNFLEYINEYDRQLYISSINMGYSVESNIVSGSLTLNQYKMIGGSDEEPEKPDLSGISLGKDNIFSNYKFGYEDMNLSVGTLENSDSAIENQGEGEASVEEEGAPENSGEAEDNSNSEETESNSEEENPPKSSKPAGGGVI